MKRGSGVWYHISSYCKYSEENCSSRGELTDVIKYAALCRITGLASSRLREFTLLSRTREVRTTDDASVLDAQMRTWYWETHADPRQIAMEMQSKRQQVWGKKSSWDKLFQVISVEKRLMLQAERSLLHCTV